MLQAYSHATLEDAEFTLASILNIISEGTWDWNALNGRVIRSAVWYRMLDYDTNEFAEDVLTWEHLIHPEDYPRVMQHFENYIQGKIERYYIQYRCKKADGSYLWILDKAQIVSRTKEGNVARMIGAHENIHDEKITHNELLAKNKLLESGNLTLEKLLEEKNKELEKKNKELELKIKEIELLSTTDALTQIANRRRFETELHNEIARSKRYGTALSLMICDIDYFKHINDTYGHQTGDMILIELASLLQKNLRVNDFLARWGGEEFVIIFPETPLEQANKIVEKLRVLVQQTTFLQDYSISCSFGITQYATGDTNDTFFSRADSMLYRAKVNGRNKVESSAKDFSLIKNKK